MGGANDLQPDSCVQGNLDPQTHGDGRAGPDVPTKPAASWTR
jgi:hypothetical protein